jgi:hypothetical protein
MQFAQTERDWSVGCLVLAKGVLAAQMMGGEKSLVNELRISCSWQSPGNCIHASAKRVPVGKTGRDAIGVVIKSFPGNLCRVAFTVVGHFLSGDGANRISRLVITWHNAAGAADASAHSVSR